MGEFKNGDIGIQLVTRGNKKKERMTTIRLKRETFDMLGVAMCKASIDNWDVPANVLAEGPLERRSRGGNRQALLAGGPSRAEC